MSVAGRPILSPSPSTDKFISTPSSRNPISLRLYKTLASSFQDSSSRDALEILSSVYAPSTKPLADTTSKLDDDFSDDDDEELYEKSNVQQPNGRALSPYPSQKSQDRIASDAAIAELARKNMRRDVEVQLMDSSFRFLQAFGQVDRKLDTLQDHMDRMRDRCDEVQSELQKTNEACKYLLDKAGGLRAQRQTTATRQTVISLFLSHFTLSDAESEAITSHDVPVGRQLFSAMDRAEQIREDCRVLLSGDGTEEGGTRAGLDIMAQTATQLDFAYAKIQRWCSYEFRQLGKESHLEVSPIMREAVRRLRFRPEILSGALSDLASIRQTTILNAFVSALTRGGPSGLPRPIELHAHDPIRYVGDMLAWVHQAMATEREFLDSLFGLGAEKRMVGSVWQQDMDSEEAALVRELMDRDLEKICTPLRIRVQQTIKSQEGSITSYKVTNLLQFYLVTMRRTIGEDALLSQTLKAMTDVSNQVFLDAIEAQGRSLLRFLHPPDADLSPPLALRDVSQVLREIMTVYDSSLLKGDSPEDEGGAEDDGSHGFTRILNAVVDPALEMCRRMAELKKDGTAWEKGIFLVNCYVHLQSVLQPFAFTAQGAARLDGEMGVHIQNLIDAHYLILLKDSGLSPIIEALATKPPETPLSRLREASSSAITTALEQFDTFLSSVDVLTSPRLALISSARLSSQIHHDALKKIVVAYGDVVHAVRSPENKFEFASTMLGKKRPFGQMSVLWQVLGVDQPGSRGS